MVSIERIFSTMFQMRFIIIFISVISDIYGQPPIYDDGALTPILDTTPETVEAIAGQTVLLPCTVTNLGSYTMSWLTQGYEMLTNNEQIMIDDDPRLSVKVIDDTSWNLQIEKVDGDDTGIYVCMVQTYPPQIKQVELSVKEKPTILPIHDTFELKEGKSFTVTCTTTGNPRPTVNWFYYRPIPDSSQGVKELYQGGHMLTINKVRKRDSGTYVCEAENTIGRAHMEIHLAIQYKPEIQMSSKRIPVKQGSEATLECVADSNPSPQILWIRQNYKLSDSWKHKVEMYADSETQKTAILIIKQTDQADAGKYRCLARNPIGQVEQYFYISVVQTTTVPPINTTRITSTTTTSSTTTTETTTTTVETKGTTQLLKPDDLTKTTKEFVTHTTAATTPKIGETKNMSSRTSINSLTFLSLLSLVYLYKFL